MAAASRGYLFNKRWVNIARDKSEGLCSMSKLTSTQRLLREKWAHMLRRGAERLPPAPRYFCLLGAIGHFVNCGLALSCVSCGWTGDASRDAMVHGIAASYLCMYTFDLVFAFIFGVSTLRGFSINRFIMHHIPAMIGISIPFFLPMHPDWHRFRLLQLSVFITENVEGYISMLHFLEQTNGFQSSDIEYYNEFRFAPAALSVFHCLAAVIDGCFFDLLTHFWKHGHFCSQPGDPYELFAIPTLASGFFFIWFFCTINFVSPGYFPMAIGVLTGARRKAKLAKAAQLPPPPAASVVPAPKTNMPHEELRQRNSKISK
jgi:hypothetical protein